MAIIELVEELEVAAATNTKTAKRKAAKEDVVAALAGDTEETAAPTAVAVADADDDVEVTDEETAAEVEAIEAEDDKK
jgi:hypothetical protein